MNEFFNLFFILFLLAFLLPVIQRRLQLGRRLRFLSDFEVGRKSRVITMIHRQEAFSLLGFPLVKYIDIEDSERVLRAIRLTADDVPIDIILHTPGGLVLASEQIASALQRHKAKVTAFVPHYAMSGGTLISLAADEIVMDEDAVLGAIDPQIGDPFRGSYPAASIIAALKEPNDNRDDTTLILGDIARKAQRQVEKLLFDLLEPRIGEERARELATALSDGRWTHDYPISADEAGEMGLPVTKGLPREVYALMDLYPQAPQRRPSVEYIPTPHQRRPTRER